MNKALTLKEHQQVMLNMMIQFDNFCNQHNLRYYLAYGTLLGAVRHHGFIPWDDDADFLMPRPDYEKLLSFDQISEDVQVVSYRNPQEYYHPFVASVLADKNTIMCEDLVKKQTGKGVFCDIFPMDGAPDNIFIKKFHYFKLQIYESLLSCGIMPESGFSSIKNSIKSLISRFMSNKNLVGYAKKIDNLAKKYQYDGSKIVIPATSLFGTPNLLFGTAEEYSDYVLLDFEGYKLRAPIAYDAVLRRCYGDYMTPPPLEKQKGHHGIEIYRR